jgi:hypothetical protein
MDAIQYLFFISRISLMKSINTTAKAELSTYVIHASSGMNVDVFTKFVMSFRTLPAGSRSRN